MPDEPQAAEPRTGLFLPDFDDLSKEWQAKLDAVVATLLAESAAWQAKVDDLTALFQQVLAELQALQGVTVRIDRAT